MPHSDDTPDGRDHPEQSSGASAGHEAPARADDPLAELARMADEDPFADFRGGAVDDGQAPAEVPSRSYGPPEPTVPEGASEPRVDRDSLYAEITAAQEREAQAMAAPAEPERAEPSYDEPEPPEARAAPSEWTEPESDVSGEASGFDPVAALAAELQAMPPQTPPEPASVETPEIPPDHGDEPWFDEWAGGRAQAHRAEPAADWPSADTVHDWAGHRQEAAESTPRFAEEELSFAGEPPAHGEGYVPTYVADDRQHVDDMPRFEEADGYAPVAADRERGGSRRGVMVVGSLVALVVLGGAAALGYRGLTGGTGGGAGEPPVIHADSTPAKVAADEPEDAADGQGKLVYDRIDGGDGDGDSRIVSREEPVFDVEAGDDAPLRVVDPETDEAVQAADRGRADPDEPRRVRTVVVRPDGTVVSNSGQVETALRPGDGDRAAEMEASDAGDALNALSRPGDDAAEATDATLAAAEDDGAAFEPPSAGEAEAETESDSEVGTDTEAETDAEPEPPAETATEDAAPSQSGQPLQLMPQDGDTPDSETSGSESEQVANAATTTSATDGEASGGFPSGSYVVQVGSTRSEDDARGSASAVAQQHSDLLSGYQTAIERADLGDRGVFYRVGVGPVDSESDADALCGSLRSAGTDCFVRRN